MTLDGGGCVMHISSVRITVQGRLFLEELEKKQEARTSLGLIKQNRWAVYKWVFAFVAGIAGGLASKYLIDFFWPTAGN